MHLIILLITTLLSLTSAFTPVSNAKDELEIRNKLSLYTFALDTKNFDWLDSVFTPDVVADYQAPGTDWFNGLDDLKAWVTPRIVGFVTQHTLSSTVVEEVNAEGGKGVNSTCYLVANYMGQGNLTGQATYVYGRYVDSWTKVKGSWYSKLRTFEALPPGIIGNIAIATTPGET